MLRTPISYYGGKQTMLKEILPLIPEHEIYTESFFGGGAVFWAKEPSKSEIINDLNTHVTNFYQVLKTNFRKLKQLVDTTLHSRPTYKAALVVYQMPQLFTKLQQAWAFWLLTNQGFSGIVGSWAYSINGKRAKTTFLKKRDFTKDLAKRLDKVQIESRDACEMIQAYDSPKSFHYIDPPYIGANQGHYSGYTEENFKELLDMLTEVSGKFLLSCYPSKLLDQYVKRYGWQMKEIKKPITANWCRNGKRRSKVEVLVWNYDEASFQQMIPIKTESGNVKTTEKEDAAFAYSAA